MSFLLWALFWGTAAHAAGPATQQTTAPKRAQDPYAGKRAMLVEEQIEKRGVRNPDVIRVMREVPRHEFVPDESRGAAYEDRPLSIGYGATISQPYIVAAMTELIEPARHHKVLEIGTGSGYQAAVMARLVKDVYSIEIVPQLAASAARTLERLGYRNVHVKHGDGYKGWPEEAPFDRIILTAAPPEIPQALIDQVKPGGKLVAPVGGPEEQHLLVLDKAQDGTVRQRTVFPVMFVPMVPAKN
jgi:protein-L-isoaspartate(D-aspartate) O-methyltransferase